MKKKILNAALISLLFAGCLTTPLPTISSLQAEKPELQFQYLKAGAYLPVNGHGSDHFLPGDTKRFKVQVPAKSGKCQLRYIDGDEDSFSDCTGKTEVELDHGAYYKNHPGVVGISIITKKFGSQFGIFYPNIGTQREPLNVAFNCPWKETRSDTSVCTRPAGYKFYFTVKPPSAGKLYFSYQCRGEPLHEETLDVVEEKIFFLDQAKPTYCVIGLGFKQLEIIQAQTIHVRFYDPAHTPEAR